MISNLDDYKWRDQRWLDKRADSNILEQPVSTYEVHLGSWRRAGAGPCDWLSYRDLAHQLVEYCQDSMSGEVFDNSVRLTLDGKQYQGCGLVLDSDWE